MSAGVTTIFHFASGCKKSPGSSFHCDYAIFVMWFKGTTQPILTHMRNPLPYEVSFKTDLVWPSPLFRAIRANILFLGCSIPDLALRCSGRTWFFKMEMCSSESYLRLLFVFLCGKDAICLPAHERMMHLLFLLYIKRSKSAVQQFFRPTDSLAW